MVGETAGQQSSASVSGEEPSLRSSKELSARNLLRQEEAGCYHGGEVGRTGVRERHRGRMPPVRSDRFRGGRRSGGPFEPPAAQRNPRAGMNRIRAVSEARTIRGPCDYGERIGCQAVQDPGASENSVPEA